MAGEAFGVVDVLAARPRSMCPDCAGWLTWGGVELLDELPVADRRPLALLVGMGAEVYRCEFCRLVGAFSPLLRL